jgi:hypothetical protein
MSDNCALPVYALVTPSQTCSECGILRAVPHAKRLQRQLRPAHRLPGAGATVLAGLSPFSGTLRGWLALQPADAPTIGGFLFLTVASLAAGMTVSAVRWAVVDTLHGRTGIRAPALDFSRLGENVGAFSLLIDIHYRHYLFYANMAVAIGTVYAGYRLRLGRVWPAGWPDVAFVLLEGVFLTASRDTLRKYYERCRQILPPKRRAGRMRRGKESGALGVKPTD